MSSGSSGVMNEELPTLEGMERRKEELEKMHSKQVLQLEKISGLSVEEQVRKQWHPSLGGLALF